MSENLGLWMQTYSGGKFWPAAPERSDFRLVDVAHALANVNRYGGHTLRPWSVAAHSVLVARLVLKRKRPDQVLAALMHDAAEAYLGDMVRPLKVLAGMDAFRRLEDELLRLLGLVFEFDYPFDPVVKECDVRAMALEREVLLAPTDDVWPGVARPHDGETPDGFSWELPVTAQVFMNYFNFAKRLRDRGATAGDRAVSRRRVR